MAFDIFVLPCLKVEGRFVLDFKGFLAVSVSFVAFSDYIRFGFQGKEVFGVLGGGEAVAMGLVEFWPRCVCIARFMTCD